MDWLYWEPEAEWTGYTKNQRLRQSGMVIYGNQGLSGLVILGTRG